MGMFARAVGSRKSEASFYDRWSEVMGLSRQSKAGPVVTRKAAFQTSVALACLRVHAHALAQAPLKLHRESEVDGLKRIQVAREHAAHKVLCRRPNAWQTSFDFRATLGLHRALGNAYVFKNRYRGEISELILLSPDQVKAEQLPDWTPKYTVRGRNGESKEFFGTDHIWHLPGLSWDGFLGLDILSLAKEVLGMLMAIDDSVSTLHAKGLRPSGVYSVEGKLDPGQYRDLSEWIKEQAGAKNTGIPLVLDRSAKWMQQTMTSVDAQTAQIRRDVMEDTCRFFGVLPIMVGHTGDKAQSFANSEVLFTAHKVYFLDAHYSAVEQSADMNLLSEEDQDAGHYFKFNANGLMRATSKDRGEYFARALGSGGTRPWMTQDEVRALEEMDPMGGDSAKLLPPVNAPAPTKSTDDDNPPANP